MHGTVTGRIRSDRPNVANKPRGEMDKLVVLDDFSGWDVEDDGEVG